MMKIGDLVTWDEETNPIPPWFYEAYNNWRDIGIIIDEFDTDTVVVHWQNGNQFPVWKIELEILSEQKEVKL
tara:strand:+ start:202 stop:417 length:216 start_codon:yes stop_codon:yes gene_type:complete